MHCTDAACVLSCPAGAIAHNDLGLVELDQEKCIGCNYCISTCTFNVIGYDRSFNRARKCNLCSDGIRKGLIPACAESCPSGAIVFGERDELDRTWPLAESKSCVKVACPGLIFMDLQNWVGLKRSTYWVKVKRIARVHMLCRKIRSSPLPPEPGAYYLSHYVLSCRWPFYLPCGLIKMNSG